MGRLTEDMKRLIADQRLCYVATVCPDGTPNLSPKGTVTAWGDDAIVFCDIRSPRTVANLRSNPAIEINVVDPFRRKGYRFKGVAEIHEGEAIFDEVVAFFRNRGVQSPIRAVVRVSLWEALPLTSPVYDLGATEAEVEERWRRYYGGPGRPGDETATGE